VVKVIYQDWTDATVSLLANWCSIAFLVFMIPVLYLQNKNLRYSILLTSGLVALGTAVRCMFVITPNISDKTSTILYHLGAVLNGIPSIVVTSAPPAVSAAWFPPDERVTATSISQMLNNVGTGLSFLLASILVKEPSLQHKNQSNVSCQGPHINQSFIVTNSSKEDLKKDIENYLIVLCVPAIVLFICSLVYFPSKPPKPPSRSSREERLDFLKGTIELVKNPSSWLLAIVWSIPQALWNNWCAMMVMSLTKIGYDGQCLTEHWVNYLGLVSVLVGTMVAIAVGMATDRIRGKMKITILSLLVAGGVMFTLLTLISLEIIVFSNMYLLQTSVYVCVLTGNSFVVSTSPLLMEFGVEKLYPISEGMIGGWLNIWYNIITVVFLGLFNIPNIGTQWLSYVLPVGCFAVIPLFMTVKEEYNRRLVDEY